MNELTADAERFRALRDMSANFAWRYAEAKRNGFDLADAITADLPSIPGVVAILNAEDFTAAVDELMRSNATSHRSAACGASGGLPGYTSGTTEKE